MAKKDSKLVNAAHIKRHTEGTSNELSFSVLDAKKNQADIEEGKGENPPAPRLGRLPIFSWRPSKKRNVGTPSKEPSLPLSGGTGDEYVPGDANASGIVSVDARTETKSNFSFTSSEDEVVRRKTRRRKRRIFGVVLGVVASLVLLAGGVYLLFNEITNHQEQVGVLEHSFEKIEEADETILAIDNVLMEPLTDREISVMEKLILQIPHAEKHLDEANGFAATAAESMRSSSEKSIAEQAVIAIDARKQMLSSAKSIMEAGVQAHKDKEALNKAWENVLEADKLAREAAAMVVVTTSENVSSSKEKNIQAKALFEEAAYVLDQLTMSFINPKIQVLQDYVAKRIEASGYSIASDEAILVQDRQRAESQNDAYNAADAEAIALARDIPEDPLTLIDQAYESYVDDKETQYLEARSSASTADAFLRDYLGTSNK